MKTERSPSHTTEPGSPKMYPFRPKSTALLKAGHYWTFRLRNGRVVCGVVIARRQKKDKIEQRLFLAGLLDWSGENEPTNGDLEGRQIKDRGYAHIKAITETGGEVRGMVAPCWNTPDVVSRSDSIGTWGYNMIRVLAEKYYGKIEGKDTAEPRSPSRADSQ